MENITIYRLEESGWSHDRNINIGSIEEFYKEKNFDIPQKIRDFLQQFGMLEIKFEKKTQVVKIDEVIEFNPISAIGKNFDDDYFKDVLSEYDVKDNVYPIGIANRGNLIILMTGSGKFYRFTDGFLCKDGDTVEEMLDCVVGECREPMYIE